MKKTSKIEQLIKNISDPTKRKILMNKLNKLSNINNKKREEDSSMLKDNFDYNIKGRIKIDQIDKDGNILKNLVDKDNLVVDKADEIVLRALSGDPYRAIYKNRTPKGGSQMVHISNHKLNGKEIVKDGEVIHNHSILWSEVEDEFFDIEYSYYPKTVFIEEVQPEKAEKKAFVVYDSPGVGRLPLTSETYSTYSNLFIGLGEGLGRRRRLEELNIEASDENAVTQTEDLIEIKAKDEFFTFDARATRVEFLFEKSENAGAVEIKVGETVLAKEDIGGQGLKGKEIHSIVLKDLKMEKPEKITVIHKGTNAGAKEPTIKVLSIITDELNKSMNQMFSEIGNYRTKFDTIISVNTRSEEPFTAKVPHHPVKPETLEVTRDGVKFKPVSSLGEVKGDKYFYDYNTGLLHFDRALTGIGLTYEISGELFEEKDLGIVYEDVLVHKDYFPEERLDTPLNPGVNINPLLQLPEKNIIEGSLVVKLNGQVVADDQILMLDLEEGTFRLAQGQDQSLANHTITASFSFNKIEETDVEVFRTKLGYEAKDETLKVVTPDGDVFKKAKEIIDLQYGGFMLDEEDPKVLYYSKIKEQDVDGSLGEDNKVTHANVLYKSDDFKGISTGYTRSLIEKPKEDGQYPWYEYDRGSIRFRAQFHEGDITENITIREMGLFDGPRVDDNFKGFSEYPVKAFSLVRVPDTVKNVSTGIQVEWIITLINEDGDHYKGGNN